MASLDQSLEQLRDATHEVASWSAQVSKHLHHIEGRSMGQNLLAHEVVRVLMTEFTMLRPFGDMQHGLRTTEDYAQKFVRSLMQVWGHPIEGPRETCKKAFVMARLMVEEAVRRCLLDLGDDLRDAFALLMVGLKQFEGEKKNREHLRVYGVFNELSLEALAYMLWAVRNEQSKFEDMPSYEAVMAPEFGPMQSEVMSMINISDEAVYRLSQLSFAEACALEVNAEGIPPEQEQEEMGWRQGPSALEEMRAAAPF